jgi:hypothetical protein
VEKQLELKTTTSFEELKKIVVGTKDERNDLVSMSSRADDEARRKKRKEAKKQQRKEEGYFIPNLYNIWHYPQRGPASKFL